MASALERAARAAKQADLNWNPNDGTWHEHVARAVLMAVREPDDAAVREGHIRLGVMPASSLEAEECFTAMIDAILNEKDTTND